MKTWSEWDWPSAERAFERAIELNPNNAYARTLYSHFLNIMGRPDEAMAQIERELKQYNNRNKYQGEKESPYNFSDQSASYKATDTRGKAWARF